MSEKKPLDAPLWLAVASVAIPIIALLIAVVVIALQGPQSPGKRPEREPGTPEQRRRVQTLKGDLQLTVDLPAEWTAGKDTTVTATIENVSTESTRLSSPAEGEAIFRLRVEDEQGGAVLENLDSEDKRVVVLELTPGQTESEDFRVPLNAGRYRMRVSALTSPTIEVPPIPITVFEK